MIKIEHTPFDKQKYLSKLVGLLIRKDLITFTDLSLYKKSLVSDIMSACFNRKNDEQILDDILDAKTEDKTAIYAAITPLITKNILTVRQLVELHKDFGIDVGKHILRTDKSKYQQMKEEINPTADQQQVIKSAEAYQDAFRIAARLTNEDVDARIFLAYLVKHNQLDIEGLKLLDTLLAEKVESTSLYRKEIESYIKYSNIHENKGLAAVLAVACCDIGLELDDISVLHYELGSRVGTILFSKGAH